ncbi:hypothetical protein CORT_0C05600 [Candida orthopsilosis Co 90-125]|uniref:DH domain-containing protein n=1 Tax=Candida orthopsilosis (strain 90-125) TaxID=1136231 RepID=H8X374_CANO9|nr:hypothetical protein CORT_0C05600 [Candida orthopsilosis Co 90-125]CCG25934.1 hypothetical protein CORT_0C05600 [Candida orthopsilosis Co 90-125]
MTTQEMPGTRTLPLYLTKEHKDYFKQELTIGPKTQARSSRLTPLSFKLNEAKSPLPTYNPLSSPTVDNTTPEAHVRFSPEVDRPKEELVRRVEEIIQTEASYVSHCSNLMIQYLSNLQHFQMELPAAVLITKECVQALIEIHRPLLQEMTSIRSKNQSIIDQCNKIAKSIAKSGVSVFWYSLYCTHYDQLVPFELFIENEKEIKNQGDTPSMKSFFLGIKNFLEGQQVAIKRKDLSFMSLCQRPVDRIVKYKLFIKGMKNTFAELGEDTTTLEKAFELISQQLTEIDESRISMQENRQLNLLVNFAGPETNPLYQRLNLEANFFGNPVAIGFASVIFVKSSKPEMIYSPIVLYKAHLVILEYNQVINRHTPGKYKPKFIIPLSNTSMVKEFRHGLSVNQSTNIKLQFRSCSNQYQVVLCFLSFEEFEFWKVKFDLLINVTHQGSCEYKSATDHLFCLTPKYLTPCWKDEYDNSEDINHYAASQLSIQVKFRIDLCLKNKVHVKYEELSPGPKYTVMLWLIDVYNSERHFKQIASKEIPFHTCTRTK